MKLATILTLCTLFFSACRPSPAFTPNRTAQPPTGVAASETSTPVFITPTQTPTLTLTPFPTVTPTPTVTNTPTIIPTPFGGGSGIVLYIQGDAISGDQSLWAMDMASLKTRKILSKTDLEQRLKNSISSIWIDYLSPDGRYGIVVECESGKQGCPYTTRIFMLNLNSLAGQKDIDGLEISTIVDLSTPYLDGRFNRLEWSPNGTKITGTIHYHNNSGCSIAVYDVTNGEMKELWKVRCGYDRDPHWSWNGAEIYWWGYTKIKVINANGSNYREIEVPGMNNLDDIHFSHNGKRVAFFDNQGLVDCKTSCKESWRNKLYLAKADFTHPTFLYEPEVQTNKYWPEVIAWSPDEQYIAIRFSCSDVGCADKAKYAEVIGTEKGKVNLLVSEKVKICGWAPDNRLVTIDANELILIDLSNLTSAPGRIPFEGECPIWINL